MSEEQAKGFIEKLKSDAKVRGRFLAFIKKEGFSCTLEEFTNAKWENLIALHYSENLPDTPNLPASEHWV
ncbi:MAG: hypothetical protein JZU70_05230 [Chlorobium sp.]|jgi:hypothetical protein|nr:hypothetical protein [Chlorobium sp.]